MVEKISSQTKKKPIQQLQQLRRIAYQPVQGNSDAVSASSQSGPQSSRQGAAIEELQLEKVIGTSSRGSNSLQVNPVNGDVCYMAGSRLVIYSPKDSKQIKFLPSRTQRPFQCVRFSSDGKYLAAGESAFRLPQIVIWEITYEDVEQVVKPSAANKLSMSMSESMTSMLQTTGHRTQSEVPNSNRDSITMTKKVTSYTEVSHLQGHKYGIEQVLFSPRNDFLISLGDPNDRGLFVWDWRKEKKISQNLLSKPALHVEISPKQDFFVTCGYQHLKFWHLNEETGMPDVRKPNAKSPPIIQAQSVDLAKVKLQIFVGIAIEWPKVFVLASDGHIYVFDKKGKLIKWMNIKVPRAFGCSAQEGRLFCACSDGIIRIFATESLQHLLSLSKPPPLGSTNLQAGNSRIRIQSNKTNKFADVVAVQIDKVNKRAVALYSDRMMFVWDVAELKSVTVQRSMYSHSGPIHDIQVVDNSHPLGLNSKATSRLRCEREDNLTKFVTCSSDRTIRFWNFIDQNNLPSHKQYSEIYSSLAKNAYSKDMSQMIFIVSAQRESGESSPGKKAKTPYDHFKSGPLERSEDGKLIDIKDQSGVELNEMVDSIRCIRISPDGQELASGDEVGNIRIHSLQSPDFAQKRFMESHDSEVISLAYSEELPTSFSSPSVTDGSRYMLASGGRDKQVLLYDSENNYEVFMNLEHHASTITSLAFNESEAASGIELISSSADKTLVSTRLDSERFDAHQGNLQLAGTDEDDALFKPGKTHICKDKIMSLDVAPSAQYCVSGHDKSLSLWRMPSFERVWEKRVGAGSLEKDMAVGGSKQSQQAGVNQVQLRVLIDRYASVVVSSSTSKRVTIYEAASGKPLCRASSGQITTAMCFSNNMRHLITTSDNGIIFIWRLPEKLAQCLQQIKNDSQRLEAAIERTESIIEEEDENDEAGDNSPEKAPVEPVQAIDFNLDEALDKIVDSPNKSNEQRENITYSPKKQEGADVLDIVNSAAASFVEEIDKKETPQIAKQEAAMDEPNEKKQESKDRLTEKSDDAEEVQDQTLDDATDGNVTGRQSTFEVAGGEQELNEDDPAADRALLRRLEAINYQKRFTNYNDEDSDLKKRRSSEMLGRKSITSQLMLRRSAAFVPGLNQYAIDNLKPSFEQNTSAFEHPLSTSSRRSGAGIFDRRNFELDNEITQKQSQDLVSDIINDNQDILQTKKPATGNPGSPRKQQSPTANSLQAAALKRDSLLIEDFQVTLKQHNVEAHKSMNTASPGRRNSNRNMFPQGKPSDTRPGFAGELHGQHSSQAESRQNQMSAISVPERQRSPIKRFADKIFGRSPDKKRVGYVQHVEPQTQQAQKRMPNVGKFQIDNDYIASPTARSAQALPRAFSNQQQQQQPQSRFQYPQANNQQVKSPQKSPQKLTLAQSQHTGTTVALPIQQPNADQSIQQQHQKQLIQQQSQFKPMFKRPNSVIEPQPSRHQTDSVLNLNTVLESDRKTARITEAQTPVPMFSQPILQEALPKSNSEVAKITQERQLSTYISEEQRFNQQLQAEVDIINKALARINQLTSIQKQKLSQQKQKFDDSMQTRKLPQHDLNPLALGNLGQTTVPLMRVHDRVSAQLYKTMKVWNTMIQDLQVSTDFDLDKLSMSFQGTSGDLMILKMDSTNSGLTANNATPKLEGQKQQQMQQAIVLADSQVSRATIQTDPYARDLLDKYSQLLLESFQSKMANSPSRTVPPPQTHPPG